MPQKLTRRELGLAGMSAALAPAAGAATESTYTGALDGFEDRVETAAFDPVFWARSRYQDAPLQMTFRASNPREAERWQKELRTKVTELIGGFPSKKAPLESQTLEVRDFPELSPRKVRF